jgi:hypothetical protein
MHIVLVYIKEDARHGKRFNNNNNNKKHSLAMAHSVLQQ